MKPRAKYLRGVQQRYCNNELTSLTLLNSGIVRLTLIFMEDGRGWETLVSSLLRKSSLLFLNCQCCTGLNHHAHFQRLTVWLTATGIHITGHEF